MTELQRLETIRRDFVTNASHDLQTPISVIRGMVEILLEDPGMLPEKRRHFLERVASQSLRLSAIVRDLLVLSRAESEVAGLERETLDLCEIVGGEVQALAPACEAQDRQLRQLLPEEPLQVTGDAKALREAVSNLLDNVLRYTPAEGRIDVELKREGDQAVIQVADTGIGIESLDQERIFERLYRVDKARSRELAGTGLGLSIVRNTVLAHGGEATVSSTPGAGSTFRVSLPVSPDRVISRRIPPS